MMIISLYHEAYNEMGTVSAPNRTNNFSEIDDLLNGIVCVS